MPPLYKEVFPVKKLDREEFILSYINDTSLKPTDDDYIKFNYIYVQKYRMFPADMFEEYDDYHKAEIYEILKENMFNEAESFLFKSGPGVQIINLIEDKIVVGKSYSDSNFIKHITGLSFLRVNIPDKNFGLSWYDRGRFIDKELEGNYFIDSYYVYEKGFIAFRISDATFDHRWALYKIMKIENPYYNRNPIDFDSIPSLKQLTPFIFFECPIQRKNYYSFTCKVEEDYSTIIGYTIDDFSINSIKKGSSQKALDFIISHYGNLEKIRDDFDKICLNNNFSMLLPFYKEDELTSFQRHYIDGL